MYSPPQQMILVHVGGAKIGRSQARADSARNFNLRLIACAFVSDDSQNRATLRL